MYIYMPTSFFRHGLHGLHGLVYIYKVLTKFRGKKSIETICHSER